MLLQTRDGYEMARNPEPPSTSTLAGRGVVTVGAGAGTFLAIAQVLDQSRSLIATAATLAALVAGGAALLRAERLKAAGWGVLFGSTVAVTAAAAAYLATVV